MTVTRRYPETRAEETADELAGVRFADPYRWLEADSDEVQAWQERQAELATAHVREWQGYDEVRGLVEQYLTERTGTVPAFGGDLWFRQHTPEGRSYPQVIAAEQPYGDGRVVADLAHYKVGDNAPFITWLSPSPDGRVLAIGVCTDGSEQNTIRLIDVASAGLIEGAPTQVLHDGWTEARRGSRTRAASTSSLCSDPCTTSARRCSCIVSASRRRRDPRTFPASTTRTNTP